MTRAVSGPMSKCASPLSSRIAVRQTPLTARLSPSASSVASAAWTRTRWPPAVALTSTSVPTASTMPVNISLNPDIRPARLDRSPATAQTGRATSTPNHLMPAGAEQVWRDDEMQPIHQSLRRPAPRAASARPRRAASRCREPPVARRASAERRSASRTSAPACSSAAARSAASPLREDPSLLSPARSRGSRTAALSAACAAGDRRPRARAGEPPALARGQQRIVDEHRLRPDRHRVHRRAQHVRLAVRLVRS